MADHIKSTRHSHPCSLNLCLSILDTKYDRPRTSLISAETAVFCVTAELAAVRTSAILRKHVDVLHVTRQRVHRWPQGTCRERSRSKGASADSSCEATRFWHCQKHQKARKLCGVLCCLYGQRLDTLHERNHEALAWYPKLLHTKSWSRLNRWCRATRPCVAGRDVSRQGPELVEICKSFESVTHQDVSKYDCPETTSTCFCMCVTDLFQHFVHIKHCVGAGKSRITPAPIARIRLSAEYNITLVRFL